MRPRWIRSLFLAWALLAAIPPIAAQDVPAALAACRAEQDDLRRLACYDRQADQLAQQPAAGGAPPAAATTQEERFGYSGVLAREEMDRKEEETRGLQELVATVTEIVTRPRGELVITLDNGQVWAQKAPDTTLRLKVGDEIKIEPGAMGSFLMFGASSKRSTRVTRLR